METYSHRGRGFGFPDNTEGAFEATTESKLHLETDVRKTKDGVLVLFHDAGKVEDKTYEELKKSLQIPTLEETLKKFGGKMKFDLDLKESAPGSEVLAMVTKYNLINNTLFTSFDFNKIKEIKDINQQAKVGYLTEAVSEDTPRFLQRAGIGAYCPHADQVTEDLVRKCHKLHMQIISWCPSSDEIMEQNIAYGVDGLIVDEPNKVREAIETTVIHKPPTPLAPQAA